MSGAGGAIAARRGRRTFVIALAVAAGATSTASCSVLLDWSGYSGALADAGHDRTLEHDAGLDADVDADASGWIDAPTLVSCGVDKLCSPPVPKVPGWAGPYALFAGAPASLPSCDPSAYVSTPAFEGKTDLDAGPARCGCSCSAAQGVRCTVPKVTFFSDSFCEASTACGPPAPLDTCVPIACPNLSIDTPTPTGGSCTPASSTTLPPASWSTAARACSPSPTTPQGSCGSQELCLPTATFCIMNSGDLQCPTEGDYPFRHVFYGGSSDQRACSPCTCGAPSGGACALPVGPNGVPVPPVGSFDMTCAVPTGQPFFVPLACAPKVPSAFGVQLFPDAGARVTSPGACATDGGVPTGEVAPTSPTTFCCTR